MCYSENARKLNPMFLKLVRKSISLYVLLKYRKIDPAVRYFYRDTYYCQLQQLKYIGKDFLSKKKYKAIVYNGEFGQELLFVLPFAYWHYKNGTLKKTVSAKYTKELYFFSPDHEERFDTRTTEGNYNFEAPRILYSHNYNMSKWSPVPLKEKYRNEVYVYQKPILIIANRYNSEWDGPPISFFSIPLLDSLFTSLKEKYTIIYNRPRPQNITNDNSDVYDLDEYDWIKKEHPEIVLMEDLYKENKGKARNFNHLQLMVYANANRFISVHGGTATLASYFGGINLILSKKGLEHHFGCFHKLFTQLSGAAILHAKTDDEVMEYVEQHFISKSTKTLPATHEI